MKPIIRTNLRSLGQWSNRHLLLLRRLDKRLMETARELPSEFVSLHAAVLACLQKIAHLKSEVDALYESDKSSALQASALPLTDSEIKRLLALNQQLKAITRHLQTVAKDVTPRLEAKLADPDDPMYDYEIDARIDYQLRQDDPDYDEDDDNYLTTRNETLKGMPDLGGREDFAEPHLPASLRAAPHCWLFHDLYDHDYGDESPALPFKDCLRIGRIFVDVQVIQQYNFEVPECDTK